MTPRRQAALLAALCALLYVPGLGAIQLYTRGEAREALAIREVVQTDRWLVPMRPDGKLTRKPPLFYWAGAAVTRLAPDSPAWAARLPSVLAATIGVLAMVLLGNAALGNAAALAALLLATSFEWYRSAISARVDMVLALGMTLVLLAWTHRLVVGSRRWTNLAAALGVTVAVLAKGPIGAGFPAVAAIVAALVSRDAAYLRLLPPLVAGAALAGCWYAAAWLAHGRAFVDVVLAENLGRFVDPSASHTGHAHGPLYLVLVGLSALLPWTPILPFAAVRGAMPKAARRLMVAWIVTIATVVMLSASKREVYLLPLFPAVAMLLADGLVAGPSPGVTRLLRATTWLYAPVLVLLALVVSVVAWGVDLAPRLTALLKPEDAVAAEAIVRTIRDDRAALAVVALATLGLAAAVARARAAGAWTRLVVPLAGALAVWGITFQLTIHPAIGNARGAADFLRAIGPLVPPGEPLFAFFPVDPNLRFYAPRPIERWQSRPDDRDAYLLVWERELAAMPKPAGGPLEPVATSGRSHGRRGALILLRVPRGALPKRLSAPSQNG